METLVLPRLQVRRSTTVRRWLPGPVLQQWQDNDGRIIAEGGRDERQWWMHWPELATFWFAGTGDVTAEAGPGDDALVRDIFTRAVLPVVLLAQGFEGFHASAVSNADGVIGFCGTSGTGKSTLAYALSVAGLDHFADDAIVYSVDDDEQPLAHRLPFPVRVEDSVRGALGAGKLRLIRERGTTGVPLRRVYQLSRDDTADPERPRFVRVEPVQRFKLLLTHARPFDLDGDARRALFLSRLLTVARKIDVWQCFFSPSLDALPSLAAAVRDHSRIQ